MAGAKYRGQTKATDSYLLRSSDGHKSLREPFNMKLLGLLIFCTQSSASRNRAQQQCNSTAMKFLQRFHEARQKLCCTRLFSSGVQAAPAAPQLQLAASRRLDAVSPRECCRPRDPVMTCDTSISRDFIPKVSSPTLQPTGPATADLSASDFAMPLFHVRKPHKALSSGLGIW